MNSEKFLSQAIESVREQKVDAEVEYIIVDGGSTDGTLSLIKKNLSVISNYVSEKDAGLYSALNKGIKMSTGDIIGFIHSDDKLAHPSVLQHYQDAFLEHGCDAAYADLVIKTRESEGREVRYWKSKPYAKGDFLQGWMPPHPTFYVKKSVYEKLGVFRTDMSHAADYELMLRFMHLHEISTHYLDKTMVNMREGGLSSRSLLGRLRATQQDRYAWKVNCLKAPILLNAKKTLSKIHQFKFFKA